MFLLKSIKIKMIYLLCYFRFKKTAKQKLDIYEVNFFL